MCALLSEAYLGAASQHSTAQLLSADGAQVVVSLQSAAVLLDSQLQLQQSFPPPLATDGSSSKPPQILGAAIDPTGRHIVANTENQLLLASLHSSSSCSSSKQGQWQQQQQASSAQPPSSGHFECAAALPGGVRSLHWGPAGRVLAVCSKTQPEVLLLEVSCTNTSRSNPATQQRQQHQAKLQPPGPLQPVLTLQPPVRQGGTPAAPTAACWLPGHSDCRGSSSEDKCQRHSGSNGGLSSSAAGRSPAEPSGLCLPHTFGLLVCWCSDLVLCVWRVDGTGSVCWDSYATHSLLSGWPGPPKALLALQPPQDTAACSNGSTSHAAPGVPAAAGSPACRPVVAHVVGIVDAPLALPGTQGLQVSAGLWPEGVNKVVGGRVSSSQPTTAASAGSAAAGPCVTEVTSSAAMAAQTTAAGLPDPQPADGAVYGVLRPRHSSSSSGSVMDALMNIHGPQQQQQQQQGGQPLLQETGAGSSNAPAAASGAAGGALFCSNGSSAGGRCSSSQSTSPLLCLLRLDLERYSPAPVELRGNGALPAGLHNDPATHCTVLPLPEQPLPRWLAVSGGLVAVGSSMGAPRVTLCAVSDAKGLQTLQTITLPLPAAVAAVHKDRAAAAGKHGSSSSGSDSDSPSSIRGTLQGLSLLPSSSSCGLLALVACTDKPPGGTLRVFGSNSSSSGGQAADLYLLKLNLGTAIQQQGQRQQQVQDVQQGPAQQLVDVAHPDDDTEAEQHPNSSMPAGGGGIDPGSRAVVAALQALQASLEGRLDALQATLQGVEGRMAALERRQL